MHPITLFSDTEKSGGSESGMNVLMITNNGEIDRMNDTALQIYPRGAFLALSV